MTPSPNFDWRTVTPSGAGGNCAKQNVINGGKAKTCRHMFRSIVQERVRQSRSGKANKSESCPRGHQDLPLPCFTAYAIKHWSRGVKFSLDGLGLLGSMKIRTSRGSEMDPLNAGIFRPKLHWEGVLEEKPLTPPAKTLTKVTWIGLTMPSRSRNRTTNVCFDREIETCSGRKVLSKHNA